MAAASTPAYEWTAEYDHGVVLSTSEPWRGLRVRYREPGTRKWSRFLFSVEGDLLPTPEQIELAISAHASQPSSATVRA